SQPAAAPASAPAPVVEKPQVAASASAAPAVSPSNGARFYSPLVLNIAASEGISMTELERIPGTGNEGRVTKKDILAYVANRGSAPVAATPSTPASPAQVAVRETAAATRTEQEVPATYAGNV